MLLETKKLEVMQEKTKKLTAEVKKGAPEQAFLRQYHATVKQGKNLQVRVIIGKHTVNIDEPLDNGGDDTAPSPEDTLLVALGTCIELSWIVYSSAFNLDIREVVVNVEGSVDQRYMLSGVNNVPARMKAVKIISRVVTNAPREKVERVYQKVQLFCPINGSLHPDIKKEYSLEINPPTN